MKPDLEEFEKITGYTFQNKSLLIQALTHSSYVNENKSEDLVPKDNERLEFFGDAIIEFYISEYLFTKYQDIPEGDLTKFRASLVCEQSLAQCSANLQLGRFLLMGKGEAMSGGRERPSITSDAFEALIAAIYLDSGERQVQMFLDEHLLKVLENKKTFFDAKTRLQEIVQQNPDSILKYEVISESGPSHNKTFITAVYLNEKEIGRGKGHSKKIAQQDAAEHAISYLEKNDNKSVCQQETGGEK